MSALVFVGLVAIAAAGAVLAFVLPHKPWGWLSAAVVVVVFAVLVAVDWSWRWVPAILFGVAVAAFKRRYVHRRRTTSASPSGIGV